MGDERRWTASYQFLDELWRGRSRIVYDPELEVVLQQGGADAGVDGPSAALFDALLPRADADARVWAVLDNDRRAASFARSRGGTVFTGLDGAAEIAGDEPWAVALINLGEALATGFSAELEGFLELLGERREDDGERTVVLAVGTEILGEDGSYERLADLIDELFGDGRIYGLTRPAMAAFYDFGTVLESESGPEGESAIEVDNTLGSEQPRFERFVAVIGPRLPSEGLTFVELPGTAGSGGAAPVPVGQGSAGEGDELAALRAQLVEAQRRGDLQAIERQALLEKLEQAEDHIAALQEQADDRAEIDGAPQADAPGLELVQAREQALRWENDRLRGELERLRARPVETLEAELAGVRVRLEAAEAELARLEAEGEDEGDDEGEDEGDDEADEDEGDDALGEAVIVIEAESPHPARQRASKQLRGRVERLLRKLERGAQVSALELHRELEKLLT